MNLPGKLNLKADTGQSNNFIQLGDYRRLGLDGRTMVRGSAYCREGTLLWHPWGWYQGSLEGHYKNTLQSSASSSGGGGGLGAHVFLQSGTCFPWQWDGPCPPNTFTPTPFSPSVPPCSLCPVTIHVQPLKTPALFRVSVCPCFVWVSRRCPGACSWRL